MTTYRQARGGPRGVSGVGLFGNPKAVLYDRDVGIDHTRNAGNRKATTHPYHGKREAERAAKRLAKQQAKDVAAEFRCNRCHRSMKGTTAYDGACECGGLIETRVSGAVA